MCLLLLQCFILLVKSWSQNSSTTEPERDHCASDYLLLYRYCRNFALVWMKYEWSTRACQFTRYNKNEGYSVLTLPFHRIPIGLRSYAQ
ncbi:hypothetical protein F4777DRAFT_329376 [Nemania sp. FL0916]|nr:hypothetical protein F4777DRAFT_329376 [Nemania sp. FL0916]